MNQVDEKTFEELLHSSEILICDFSSPGCGPCKKVPPFLTEVLGELDDPRISSCEVNVAAAMDLARRYLIMSVPTIIVFKKGQETARFTALPKKEKLIAALS